MMDVISARNVYSEIQARLNALENHINVLEHSVDTSREKYNTVKTELQRIEHGILSGDFGGYYRENRTPLLQRVDQLLMMIGETPVQRPDYVYCQTRQQFYEREYDSGGVNRTQIPSYILQRIIHDREQNEKQKQNPYNVSPVLPLFRSITDKSIIQDTCSICLSTFIDSDNNTPTYLACKHRFHYSCINEWIKTSKRDTCPVCKQDIYVL